MADAFRRILVLLIALALSIGLFSAFSHLIAPDRQGLLSLVSPANPGAGPAGGSDSPEPYTLAPPAEELPGLSALSQEYANLMERVRPAVVSIDTETTVTLQRQVNYFQIADFDEKRPGLGSGVIVSKEGHVLTNHHVIDGVDKIYVTTNSGDRYDCSLIGYRAGSDLSVLKINTGETGTEFPALPFGDSDAVRVGEIVFAIGNPFGLGETVTQGIISALPRPLSDSDFKTFQTDTVINPGNSGGPLVNTDGEIIGVTTAIYVNGADQSYAGVSLAIPSNDARNAFEGIMAKGKPDTGYFGVHARDIIGYDRGVLISYVTPESPADVAGLKKNDIVVRFAERLIRSPEQLFELIARTTIGKTVPVEIIRGRDEGVLQATIVSQDEFFSSPPAEENEEAAARISDALGITVTHLSSYYRHRVGILPSSPGIVVTSVDSDAVVANQLQAGDILYALGEKSIRTPEQFNTLINSLPLGKEAQLFYFRNGFRGIVRFTPNEKR